MRVALIPGMNVDDPMRSIGKLKGKLEAHGHECRIIYYGHYNIFQVRQERHRAVRLIKSILPNVDALVSHSNGGNYEDLALKSEEHLPKRYLTFRIAPALNRTCPMPKNVDKMVVMHSRGDRWVELGAWLPFHRFGRMGSRGYKGPELGTRAVNLDWTHIYPDHSDPFDDEVIDFTTSEICGLLNHAMAQ